MSRKFSVFAGFGPEAIIVMVLGFVPSYTTASVLLVLAEGMAGLGIAGLARLIHCISRLKLIAARFVEAEHFGYSLRKSMPIYIIYEENEMESDLPATYRLDLPSLGDR